MDEARIQDTRQRDTETNILAHIVDAMLEAQADLHDATIEEWTRALITSCRQRKQRAGGQGGVIAASC